MAVDYIIETIQLKRGVSTDFVSNNPTLLEGEAGYELDTNKLKIGDGIKDWNTLDYLTAETGGIPTVLSDLADVASASPANRFALLGTGTTFVSRALVLQDITDYDTNNIISDFDTALAQTRWKAIEVPTGGTINQVLAKSSGTNYDVGWQTPSSNQHVIQEEGGNLTARTNLNFIGANVTATDNSGNDATDITITTAGDSANVKDYGAIGDGIANDSTAFTNAIATGKSIYVPAGTYKASFDLGNNQIIFGDSAKNKSIIKPATGDTYVIRINAATVTKQHCQIKNLTISNIDTIASCVGILFNADDVNDINDWHTIENIFIDGFDRGIEILGRQIWSTYKSIEITNSTIGLNVSTDVTNSAFNNNNFIQFHVSNSADEGIKMIGRNQNIKFINGNIENCNTNDTAGDAGIYIEDSEDIVFDTCYLENNGDGVTVDTGTISNNSIGIRFDGTFNYNAKITNCRLVGSGVMVWLPDGTVFRGGEMDNNRIVPLATGYSIYVNTDMPDRTTPRFKYCHTNYDDSKIEIESDSNGNYPLEVSQSNAQTYYGADVSTDLRTLTTMVVNPNGTTYTGTSDIVNLFPGMRFTIYNRNNTNTFTIDSTLMIDAVNEVIETEESAQFVVTGFPAANKLRRIDPNPTSIAGITGTKAEFDTAVIDGNILYVGDAQTLATGVSDVTATATEINNAADLSGLTAGDVYSADTATTASWKAQAGGSSLPVVDTTSIVEGSVDNTKELKFEVDGNTTAIIGTIATAFTTAKTMTVPDATDTFVGKATTDTFTNKTFDANGTGNSLSNVDVADLANGTDGELITWDAAGAPAVVPVGTVDHVLTSGGTGVAPTFQALPVEIGVACSDETSDLVAGTAVTTFRMPYAMTLTDVRANVNTGGSGTGNITVDINEDGTTVLSVKLTIDGGTNPVATLTLSANAANTNTCTIGSKVYTFQDTLTDTDGNVHIGAAATNTIDNLIAAINLSGGTPGTDYAASMTKNTDVSAAAGTGDTMDVKGLVANDTDITTADNNANMSWDGDVNGGVNPELTSETAATGPTISDSALADDAEITVDIDSLGSDDAGKGLKVWLIGTRT